MKKIIAAIVLVALSTASARAQESTTQKASISIGLEAGLPVGSPGVSLLYSFAIGASLQCTYFVSPAFGVSLSAGYINYLPKNGQKDGGLVPVLAGIRYYVTPRVYVSGQLGVSFSTGSNGPGTFSGGSSFTYAPGIGFKVSRNVDVLVRYEAAAKNSITIGNIGARIAYNFD